MATLHTVNKSPARGDALARCLRFAYHGDGVLLIEDGVYSGLRGSEALAELDALAGLCRVWVLDADARARGVEHRLAEWLGRVDDAGFVALAAEHDRVVSWL